MAIEAMTRELRFASVIAWPPPGQPDSRVRFRKLESDGSQSTLGFQLGLSSGQNPKAIYRTNTLGQASPLTENVASTLRFEYIEPRLVKIELIVTDDATGQQDFISTSVTCVNVVE